MISRIVTLFVIVVLALPSATLPRPADPFPSPWSDVAVEAKGKKHKHKKKPKFRTVRQEVTRTFSSTEPITIPNGAPTTEKGPASPYPTAIEVSEFTKGTMVDVNLILTGFTHTYPEDVDILLSSSDGRQALVMSDAGDNDEVAEIDLTLDDEAAAPLPESVALSSGTFRPSNFDGIDTFAAPAPTPNGNVALSAFDGADPNGTWQLWVMDNSNTDHGDIGRWSLQITAEADVKVKQHKKKHKK